MKIHLCDGNIIRLVFGNLEYIGDVVASILQTFYYGFRHDEIIIVTQSEKRKEYIRNAVYIETNGRHMLNDFVRGQYSMYKPLPKKFSSLHISVLPDIKDVIFNPPATIVTWNDGTKTVVKASEGEAYDPEKGLAMAFSRKALGNHYEYYNTFLHYLKKTPFMNPPVEAVDDKEAADLKRYYDAALIKMY